MKSNFRRSPFLTILPIIFLTTFEFLSKNPVHSSSICPSRTLILPCTCVSSSINDISLTCTGDEVSQTTIGNLLAAVQSANNISTKFDPKNRKAIEQQTIHHFSLTGTTLVTLDLTPFLSWSFQQFYVYRNQFLKNLMIGKGAIRSPGVGISAKDVQVDTNVLTDDSASMLIKILLPGRKVQELSMRENRLTEVPSFDTLKELTKLDLAYNHIETVEDGPFRELVKLEQLNLEGNDIRRLGKDGLRFEEPDLFEDGQLTIYLDSNRLTDEGIDSKCGLEDLRKHVKLYLRKNEFTTISQKKWEKFLLSTKERVVKFWGNPFQCNDTVNWVTRVKRMDGADLKGTVFGLDCENDKGKNVFNSRKVR